VDVEGLGGGGGVCGFVLGGWVSKSLGYPPVDSLLRGAVIGGIDVPRSYPYIPTLAEPRGKGVLGRRRRRGGLDRRLLDCGLLRSRMCLGSLV